MSVGAIVGIVIACLIFVAPVIVFAIFKLMQKRNNLQKKEEYSSKVNEIKKLMDENKKH